MQRLAPNIYLWQDSRDTNLGLVLTEAGAIVIDTPLYPDEARRWRQEVDKLAQGRVLYVVNTDHHLGHWLGNFAFEGVPTVAHRYVATHVAEKYDETFRGRLVESFRASDPIVAEQMAQIPFIPPQVGVADRLFFDKGDVTIEVRHLGGHTPASLIVRVAEADVVFTGDLLVKERHPYLGEANTTQWLTALAQLQKMDGTLVPGHGPVCTRKDVRTLTEYIEEMTRAVSEFYRAGLSRKDTVSKVKMLDWFPVKEKEQARAEQRMKTSLQRVYDEIKEREKAQEGKKE